MVIEIPNSLKTKEIESKELPNNWYKYENYKSCQILGDEWLEHSETCILKVPSAIINMEFNFLINPNHQDFRKIKIITVEKFQFGPRLKI